MTPGELAALIVGGTLAVTGLVILAWALTSLPGDRTPGWPLLRRRHRW
ncbi:MAG TPA: hypothetical protein VFR67_06065 [Pilimelia sp.]|nr:hypothetical protein [Pilimelia sp.]